MRKQRVQLSGKYRSLARRLRTYHGHYGTNTKIFPGNTNKLKGTGTFSNTILALLSAGSYSVVQLLSLSAKP
jgi:hypothetical protein